MCLVTVELGEELVRKYMPMVRHIVRSTNADNFSEFEDLIQEGLIGLLAAIDEYDEDHKGMKFSSFAYLCIIRKIYNCLRRSNNNKHKALRGAISLHAFVDQEETRTVMDLMANESINPEEVIEEKWMTQKLRQVLQNHLSILEFAVATLLSRGYSISEIEKEIGVDAKSVDNARTRVRSKVVRIIRKYGSLLNPNVPQRVRKRQDLYLQVGLTYKKACSPRNLDKQVDPTALITEINQT